MAAMAEAAPGAGIDDIVGGMRAMKTESKEDGDTDALTTAELMERLEFFFSAPEFTSAVRAFVDEHEGAFVYVEEGEEQPLGNHDIYLKYTKLIEDLLESFLSSHGIDHQDIAQLCQQERESGNQTSYCLEYLLASTEYDAFVQMMCDFHGIKGFEVYGDDFVGLDCLGFGALEGLTEGGGKGSGEGEGAGNEGATPEAGSGGQ